MKYGSTILWLTLLCLISCKESNGQNECANDNIYGNWGLVESKNISLKQDYKEIYIDSNYITIFGGSLEQTMGEYDYESENSVYYLIDENGEKSIEFKICQNGNVLEIFNASAELEVYKRHLSDKPKLSDFLFGNLSLDEFRVYFFERKLNWQKSD